jgi:hypothetical protein
MNDDAPPKPKPVGYRSPPSASRFRKGRSGNPAGRPRKTRSSNPAGMVMLEDLVLKEAYRPVTIHENGKPETLPMIQAIMRALSVSAAKGSHRAQMMIAKLVGQVEDNRQKTRQEIFEGMTLYKRQWAATFADCDAQNLAHPDVVPHPDDIAICSSTGTVFFNGPMDKDEQALWEFMDDRAEIALEEIALLEHEIERHPDRSEVLQARIEKHRADYDFFTGAFPSPEMRRIAGFRLAEWRNADPFVRKLAVRRKVWLSI